MHGMVEEGIRHLAIRSLDPHPPRREAGRVLLRQRVCTLLARASHRDVTDAGRADTKRPAARIGVRGASAPTPANCSRRLPSCREHAFVGPGSTRRPDPAGALAEARWFVLVCGMVSLRRQVCRSSAPGEIRLNEAATQHSAHEYWPCVTRLFGNCRSVCVCFPEYCMSSWGYG